MHVYILFLSSILFSVCSSHTFFLTLYLHFYLNLCPSLSPSLSICLPISNSFYLSVSPPLIYICPCLNLYRSICLSLTVSLSLSLTCWWLPHPSVHSVTSTSTSPSNFLGLLVRTVYKIFNCSFPPPPLCLRGGWWLWLCLVASLSPLSSFIRLALSISNHLYLQMH